jgi:ADP-ribosyl-[dinitrogen reductase] hydrolase
MPTRWERIEGGIVGLLVGDALGVPYEFNPPHELPARAAIELVPPPGFSRSHPSAPPGTWSDDGAHALCLLDSLLARGALDIDDLATRLVRWYQDGYLAVDGQVFDVGIQTANALRAIGGGVPVRKAAASDERANGNGSLMRVLPLALWHRGTEAELVRDACAQSIVTHGHLRSQLCCALYCLWVRALLEERATPWAEAVAGLRRHIAGDEAAEAELEFHIRPDDPPGGGGSGYVVDCLRSARLALAAGPYEDVVKAAVALGHDTDTTAAVAGGVAGVRDGVGAIPERWRVSLRGQELLQPLLVRLRAATGT